MRALGHNPDISTAEEDLWEKGGIYVYPTAGMGMEVVSTGTDAADDDGAPLGTGIQQVEIHYLDDTWTPQTETLVMNGTTPVPTIATDIFRIQGFHAILVGSGGSCAGATGIDLRHLDDTPVYGHIANGDNSELQAIWTVPLGQTVFITDWDISSAGTTANRWSRFLLRATANEDEYDAGVFHDKDISIVSAGSHNIPFTLPIKIPAKSDIKISVLASGSVNCAGSFEGWCKT